MADKQTYANIKRMKEENEECMKMLRENDEEIKNLKKEVKSLRCSEVSVEDHQKVCDFLNNEAEEYKKKYQEARDELRIYKMTADEYSDVFVKVGELVENTNLPRIGEQLVIEFRKIKEENEYLNNRYKNAIKIIDATSAYDIDLDCDNEVDDYLEGLL
jgi:uncharacterized protein YukE